MKPVTVVDTLDMPVADRLRLQEGIWESLASNPDGIPVSDSQRAELDRRLELHAREPRASTWAEVRSRMPG